MGIVYEFVVCLFVLFEHDMNDSGMKQILPGWIFFPSSETKQPMQN